MGLFIFIVALAVGVYAGMQAYLWLDNEIHGLLAALLGFAAGLVAYSIVVAVLDALLNG